MNTGIGDAFNLGWKLASAFSGNASDWLLDTYQAERRPVAVEIVKQTSRDWHILIGHTVYSRLFRDHVLLPLLRWPAMQRRWLEAGSQLRISYRGGPLAATTIGDRLWTFIHNTPLAGDRAPDAACRVMPRCEETTLGTLIGAHWALLLFGGAPTDWRACIAAARRDLDGVMVVRVLSNGSTAAPVDHLEVEAVVQDVGGALASAYRPNRRAAILLRPDGHIAWRSAHAAPGGLVRWLRRSFDADKVHRSERTPRRAVFASDRVD